MGHQVALTATAAAGLTSGRRSGRQTGDQTREGTHMYEITRERIAELRDMASPQHIEQAYRLMADVSDCYEQQGINATLAIAHLLLAARKDKP